MAPKYLNGRQAADMLRYKSLSVINRLVRDGALTDLATTSPGRGRHHYRFDVAQVRALAKGGVAAARAQAEPAPVPGPLTYDPKPAHHRNGHGDTTLDLPLAAPALTGPAGLLSRLDRIERALEHLIGLWK